MNNTHNESEKEALLKLHEMATKDIKEGKVGSVKELIKKFDTHFNQGYRESSRPKKPYKLSYTAEELEGKNLKAHRDGYMEGGEVFCFEGNVYETRRICPLNKWIAFTNQLGDEHIWDLSTLGEYFHPVNKVKRGVGTKGTKVKGTKRYSENWKHHISKKKFERCVKYHCENIKPDSKYPIYYCGETRTVYQKCSMKDQYLATHLDRVPKHRNHVLYMWNNYINSHLAEIIIEYKKEENIKVKEDNNVKEESLEDKISRVKKMIREENLEVKEGNTEWTDKHYGFTYIISEEDIKNGYLKVDPYFVNEVWGLNKKELTGVGFHCLKTLARWCAKNTEEREIRAMYGQITRLAEMRGVKL